MGKKKGNLLVCLFEITCWKTDCFMVFFVGVIWLCGGCNPKKWPSEKKQFWKKISKMSDKQKIGQQFIQAYYSTLIQNANDLSKFYDQEASIWRESFGNGESKKVEDCKDNLFPAVQQGSEVAITSFADNSFPGGFHISVFGHIIKDSITSVFNQTFVLLQRSDRIFIVSDALKIVKDTEVVDTKAATYNYQFNKPKNFAPYTPSKQ